MSRIGKLPVTVPEKVSLNVAGGTVGVKGPLGELKETFKLERVSVSLEEKALHVRRKEETREARMEQGMVRALVANMVQGVTAGFSRELNIVGVGYGAEVKGTHLNLKLGFSHPVALPAPPGIKFECPTQVKIRISGSDKQLVGEIAAQIRRLRPPDPYKGKGVIYADEKILRKAGKSGGK